MSIQRIASLLAAGTEILYGLGLGEQVVAVSHECDFPEEVLRKPRVTSTRVAVHASSRAIHDEVGEMSSDGSGLYAIDVDRLAALAPDLIITQAQCDVCAVNYDDVVRAIQTVEGLKHARIVALNPRTLGDIYADIRRVAEAAGCLDQADEYVAQLRGRVEAIRKRTDSVPPERRPRVVGIEWIDPVMVAANWMPELIELAGGRCELTRPGEESRSTDWNRVVEYDPEVIVIMPCGFDLPRTLDEARQLSALPGWRTLSAVRHRCVFAVDGNAYFNRSGPRIVDSLEILARLIQPELFGGPAGPESCARPIDFDE